MDGGSPKLKLDLNKKISEASSLNDYRPNSQLSGDHQTPHRVINIMQAATRSEVGKLKGIDEQGHRAQNTQTHENPAIPKQTKSRRNWTDQLHLQFLKAVEFLGGAQVASPRLIKQAMNVEGLTNNEIKSHLQAYRKKLAKDKKREREEEDNIWENGLHFSTSKLDQDIDDCCSTNGK